jgi:glutamate racemase
VNPLAIFDSGVGGLSVAREIRRALPSEDLLYVADSAYCPYGDRPDAEVRARALAVGRYLAGAGAKLIVVACNTATGAALEDLRKAVDVPVVGLEPAVKIAARVTRAGRIGVLATTSTVRSERLGRLIRTHAQGALVVTQPCPGLADLVEEGRHDDDGALDRTLEDLTRPLREAGVDAVVLGCTHYAFVAPALARALGPDVVLVDSAEAIARRVEHLLREAGGLASGGPGSVRVLTTGRPESVGPVVERLWRSPVSVDRLDV